MGAERTAWMSDRLRLTLSCYAVLALPLGSVATISTVPAAVAGGTRINRRMEPWNSTISASFSPKRTRVSAPKRAPSSSNSVPPLTSPWRTRRPAVSYNSEIAGGAEDGGEMGAYHHLHLVASREAVITKLKDFLPTGIKPVMIPDHSLHRLPGEIGDVGSE